MTKQKKSLTPLVAAVIILALVALILMLTIVQQNKEREPSSPSSSAAESLDTASSGVESSISGAESSTDMSSPVSESSAAAPAESSGLESSDAVESSGASESSETSSSPDASSQESIPSSATNGPSYDTVNDEVLSCLLSRDFEGLSGFVAQDGLRLSPTGEQIGKDVVLTSAEVAGFFSSGTRTYGTNPGSGESITLTPAVYYSEYIAPQDLDFSSAIISYDAEEDIALCGLTENAHTVSYYASPNIMEWQKIVLVYTRTSDGDKLAGILYLDQFT